MPRSDTMPDVATAAPREDHRARPRRRGRALDKAILNATVAEIEISGYAGLSMERVAERARASKASLYRRWPSKVELVMDAIYDLLPDPAATADTGSLRGDLLALLRSAAEMLAGPGGTAIRGLISEALRDPGQAAQLRRYTRGRSLAEMREVVQRAMERGELPRGTITDSPAGCRVGGDALPLPDPRGPRAGPRDRRDRRRGGAAAAARGSQRRAAEW